ncbi:hypothetical protein N7450_011573 [Penicillium hetheringtonii]|uniref:Uncharacterized protein n=1 Tax=Penicillium hetheringtonii TaxID=911720 RepID=A0AAD6DBW5_9EURO|nr:hypothetical protein N7450_011573 [Penicillium hetheringtonii]
MSAQLRSRVHAYISSASRTSPTSNDLIVELRTLSATATEMLEIATDSTRKDSVNAASDSESARDALNQLATVYELYTTGGKINELGGGDGATKAGQPSPGIKITFDPKNIFDTLRADIRNRFEQKVLELRKAVRSIEEKAQI